MSTANGHTTLAKALALRDAGLSILPVARDGSKRPDVSRLPHVLGEDGRGRATWDCFKEELAAREDVESRWFRRRQTARNRRYRRRGQRRAGASSISSTPMPRKPSPHGASWSRSRRARPSRPLVGRPRTPKARIPRSLPAASDIDTPGNTKLATDPIAPSEERCLIETRGEGGYAIAPGSPAECHKTGRLYIHHSGPELENVQAIGIEERETLIRAARSFDRSAASEEPKAAGGNGLPAGDDFNGRGPDWPAILAPHGWVAAHLRAKVTYWRRPGKEGKGWSATTGACRSKAGRELFYVFSSNAAPFEPEKSYSKFGVYWRRSITAVISPRRRGTLRGRDTASSGGRG